MNRAAADVPGADPEALLAECLAAPAAERPRRLDELCGRHPHQSEDLRRLYRALDGYGLVDEPETTPSASPERLGSYRLLSVLGAGGMGTVHLALQEGVGRKVALKLMHRGQIATPHARERFRREILALSRLEHANICPVYDAGEVDGVPFLAMRHIAGETLLARIERRRAAGERLTRDELLRLVLVGEKLARALHAAHTRGLVHRDVKPGNIMLEAASEEPLLLDFGLARHDSGDVAGLTESSDRLGTPAYMAPEQVAGGRGDARTDVYALAASLYEALTLHLPHEAPTREALYRHILTSDVVCAGRSEPVVPRDLDVVLATALAREPDRRYATSAAFADDLARVRRHEPIQARPAGPLLRMRRFAQRNPFAAGLVAVLFLATIALVWFARERSAALVEAQASLAAHAAQDTVVHDPVRAMRQALQAPDSQEVRSALYAAVESSHERWRYTGTGVAHGVLFSPDGATLLARVGQQAVLLERATGRELRVVPHSDTAQGIGFAPHAARFVATGGNEAAIWNFAGVERVPLAHPARPAGAPTDIDAFMAVFRQPQAGSVVACTFSPDGSRVLTSAGDWCVRVFDAATGAPVAEPLRHDALVGLLVWSPDGSRLATGEGWDALPSRPGPHHVRVFDAANGFQDPKVFPVPGRVLDLDWSPDGRELAVACEDGVARLFDPERGSCREVQVGSWVWSVRWSPDGRYFVIAARDGSVRLHSRDGERVATVSHSEAHSARFLPDGQRVLVVFGDLTVRLYDLQLRELLVLSGHSGHVVMAEVSPDGTQAATVGFDGTVRLWDLFDPELPVLTGHLDKIVGLAERPDGRLVSVGGDGTLRCWDPRTGRETQRPIPLIDRPWAMTLHDDGRHVLCAHWESTAASYDLDAPALSPVRFPQPGGLGMAAEWASDGSVWTAGRSLRTFAHASDGSRRTQLPWQGGQIVAMARSAQGRMAAAGVGGAIILLRASGEVERRWFGHDSWVHTLAWSPDGQWLASGADDRAVRLWQRETGERRELVGHTGRVMAVAWSIDGALLASASSDGSVRIWNADTAECVATLRLPGGAGVDAVLWSRDGRFLWAAGDDGMIRAWPATVPRLRELALSRVARLEAVGR